MDDKATYGQWLREIKDMEGGWLGFVVILMTVVCTGLGGWFGLNLFSSGSYPGIVLAIPGLLAGAAGFFISSAVLWNTKRPAETAVPQNEKE